MVIGFKPQFKSPIMFGEKIHTIRADKNNRYKPGKFLHMALNVRTKNYECFKITTISHIQHIKIKYVQVHMFKIMTVYIDGDKLTKDQIYLLAKNDGFNNLKDFKEWFNTDFEGKIIHWTDNYYANGNLFLCKSMNPDEFDMAYVSNYIKPLSEIEKIIDNIQKKHE